MFAHRHAFGFAYVSSHVLIRPFHFSAIKNHGLWAYVFFGVSRIGAKVRFNRI